MRIGESYASFYANVGEYQRSTQASVTQANPASGTEKISTGCSTCSNRRYQDISNDPGVSFKSPTKMTPGQAASGVMAHEREHYSREKSKAESEGKEVVSNNIRIFTDTCPECGRVYVSGGETQTMTKSLKAEKEALDDEIRGPNIDVRV